MTREQFEAFLTGLGLKLDDVEAKFAELRAAFPEGTVAADSALAWFVANVTTPLSPQTVIASFGEAWMQLTGQRPGYNPHHGRIA